MFGLYGIPLGGKKLDCLLLLIKFMENRSFSVPQNVLARLLKSEKESFIANYGKGYGLQTDEILILGFQKIFCWEYLSTTKLIRVRLLISSISWMSL